jgi:hypothetical protein
MSVKVFNGLPTEIKELIHDVKKFKRILKNFLDSFFFYTL